MAEAIPGTKGRRIREGLTGSRIGSSSAVERQTVDANFSFGRQRTLKSLETRLVGFLWRRVLLGLDVIRGRWDVRSLSYPVLLGRHVQPAVLWRWVHDRGWFSSHVVSSGRILPLTYCATCQELSC